MINNYSNELLIWNDKVSERKSYYVLILLRDNFLHLCFTLSVFYSILCSLDKNYYTNYLTTTLLKYQNIKKIHIDKLLSIPNSNLLLLEYNSD